MTDNWEFDLQTNRKKEAGLSENDRIFSVLGQIESGYRGKHMIVGGIGVQGALGKEYRISHDIDICLPYKDEAEMISFLGEIGFSPRDENERLLGSGTVLSNGEFIVDLVGGEFTNSGLRLRMSSGELFIPSEGLDNKVSLRGIDFLTFTPEVHYLLKNRMVSWNPMNTVYLFAKRKHDISDFRELKQIIDSAKVKGLIEKGFSYKGIHPIIGKIFKDI